MHVPPGALIESSRPRARPRPGTTFLYEFFYTGKLHGSQKAPRPQEAEPGKAHPARNLAPVRWKADRDPHLRIEHRINEGPEPGKAQPPPRDPSPEVIPVARRRRLNRRKVSRPRNRGNLRDYNVPASHAQRVERQVSHLLPSIPERWHTQGKKMLRRI